MSERIAVVRVPVWSDGPVICLLPALPPPGLLWQVHKAYMWSLSISASCSSLTKKSKCITEIGCVQTSSMCIQTCHGHGESGCNLTSYRFDCHWCVLCPCDWLTLKHKATDDVHVSHFSCHWTYWLLCIGKTLKHFCLFHVFESHINRKLYLLATN